VPGRETMANPFVHIELHAQDPEVAKKFYRELFDWKPEDIANMNYTVINVGEPGRGMDS
jgi:predicted enzyme related to lactoylglutathione lyase